ncbi:MAG: alpha/beta fold hydrolase [Dehalococcoidia bacterium]
MPTEQQTGQVISTDGTPIAYERRGEGQPLVLVHGTGADHTRWEPIIPAFADRFTVYAVDRRGRGASGDAPAYAIEREFDDIAAVVGSIGGEVDLLGHSYGALCALEATLRTDRLRKLILYEPPIPTGIQIFRPGSVDRLDALLAAGNREAVLTTFWGDIAGLPPDQIERIRALPDWQVLVAAAHTIPREMRCSEEYRFESARFSRTHTPSLLLLGGDSPPFHQAGTAAVHAALPESRITVMPGQQHMAMDTAPDLFLGEVLRFLATD